MKKVLSSQEIAEKYVLGKGATALTDNQEIADMVEDINNLVLEELRKNGLLGYPMADGKKAAKDKGTLKDLIYEVAKEIKKDPNYGGEVIVFSEPIEEEKQSKSDIISCINVLAEQKEDENYNLFFKYMQHICDNHGSVHIDFWLNDSNSNIKFSESEVKKLQDMNKMIK